jgi:hypothetical protein
MIVENVSSNVLVAAGALWVGTDRHSTGAGVWRSWKVTEMLVLQLSYTNIKATKRPPL